MAYILTDDDKIAVLNALKAEKLAAEKQLALEQYRAVALNDARKTSDLDKALDDAIAQLTK